MQMLSKFQPFKAMAIGADPYLPGFMKQGYDKFINSIGGASANLPIDMAWVNIAGKITNSAPAYSGTGNEKIDAVGPVNFLMMAEKWSPIKDQEFGGKTFTGN